MKALLAQTSQEVGAFFNENWEFYNRTVKSNILCHEKMFATLDVFLRDRFSGPFSFVDCGCGDGSAVVKTLVGTPVSQYVGIDAAPDVLDSAAKVMEDLHCPKRFVCSDMAKAIDELEEPVDVIFSSYALHHLSYDQKVDFIKSCWNSLKEGGYFIMVDGVREEGETREQWLTRAEKRFINASLNATQEEIRSFMQHPIDADFPETLATFERLAKLQGWQKFSVLVNENNFLAFVVFYR